MVQILVLVGGLMLVLVASRWAFRAPRTPSS